MTTRNRTSIMRNSSNAVFVLLLVTGLLSVPASTSHGGLVYTFSGVIPNTVVPTHPSVLPGESWTASFVINPVAGVPGGGLMTYPGAATSGLLTFSGGFVSPINLANSDVVIYKNSDGDVVTVSKRVKITYADGTQKERDIIFAAHSQLAPLPSLDLPPAGTIVLPESYRQYPFNYTELAYNDAKGQVSYGVRDSHNVSFSATVPEPTSLALASLLGTSLVLARRLR